MLVLQARQGVCIMVGNQVGFWRMIVFEAMEFFEESKYILAIELIKFCQ